MYYYKFDGDNLVHTLIDDVKPDGYVDFGGPVDWTKKRYVDGVLDDIPLPPVPEPYVPTAEEVAAQTKQQLNWAIQNHLDAAARALGYDDVFTAVTYAEESTVAKFQTEGKAFRKWRSAVWAFCYAYLDEVTAGTKPVPTETELIALLPALSMA